MELTPATFTEKLTGAIAAQKTLLVAGLDPNPEMLPDSLRTGDLIQNLKTWLLGIIDQTQDLVCAYKPTLGFYQALGVPGLQLLETVLEHIPSHIAVILDAKHADLNTSSIFAQAIFETWQVDAVTLSAYPGQDHVAPFLLYPDKGVFLQCRTSNPGAFPLQNYPDLERPFYLHLIQEIKQWGTPEQLFLEIGGDRPEVFRQVRAIAPERWILARSIWQRSENLEEIIHQGLNSNGSGLLIPIPNDDLSQTDCRQPVAQLRQKIEDIRRRYTPSNARCDLLQTPTNFPTAHPQAELIVQLFDLGCLLFGEYVQASGATFSYYIDLRKIISNPQVFNQVLNAYGAIAKTLKFDRIAGIPYGSLPTATGLALKLNYPMIFPRKEVKAHGTRRVIEGHFEPGETILVVDDVLITGKSIVEGAKKLESAGLAVKDMVVLIDHEAGVKDRLQAQGYQAHAILTISEITETLFQAGRIDQNQYDCLVSH
ncbi:bifunctional orotidine 5'-phosphate decarboxylase/orotate phosphoribosyltransferase [Picosynechococcus sp. PCC 7003]|uniref:bifunctional orotidine-5'-phosphate decarboxylase/orotate phosphoribosyltransferase n=1 Tax=Picosynechococcus sp. PCC 7003 TaxID=374981 RepID=UPI000810D699|nr:bifunctional orotidine-5'-phosphate decarboxylase/orotate phosphoribosyltransferase [Picosynechococcus sp. PCC 7003]ANV83470.1 bifunctional orotidine 5'-phosphate decarboxylase/orotate phosphoribosyltransferase [Picosynechococcus sp. PCC 7003]